MITYGLIGYPLSHSFSAKYFTEKFRKEGITDHSYQLFPVATLEDLPTVLRTPGLLGLNVTIPYKSTVIPYLDEIDARSESTGAVNTIKIIHTNENLILKGYNTDIDGFMSSDDFSGYRSALVLGTGGASKAVMFALDRLGIEYLPVSRQLQPFNHLLYKDLNEEIIRKYHLIINATPVGMYPDSGSCPDIPYEYLTKDHFLYDLVYNPEMTTFLKKGAERGCRIRNGLRMLHLQAEKSWEIWNET